MFFSQAKKIVVHNGSFHSDDVFACAVVTHYFDLAKKRYKIIRTRDQDIIESADIVIDVGGIHDAEQGRFDHHQKEGAGKRDNGIPYASFGLVWKAFGPILTKGQKQVYEEIDRRLVQPIDAIDNGITISESVECGLYDFGIHGIVSAFQAQEDEGVHAQDKHFLELMNFLKKVLTREIESTSRRIARIESIVDYYEMSHTSTPESNTILTLDFSAGIGEMMQALQTKKDLLYVVGPRSDGNWKVTALRKDPCRFENRKDFPASWGGKRDQELQEATGISDAVFCHKALWLCVAKSKEGALALAKKAVAASA